MLNNLQQYQDDELKTIIAQANKLLDERDRERKAEAARQIKEMAAKAGLRIEIKGARKRRGRPSKNPKQNTNEQSS